MCGRRDSNPHGLLRQILSLVRLPISPRPHLFLKNSFKKGREDTFFLRPFNFILSVELSFFRICELPICMRFIKSGKESLKTDDELISAFRLSRNPLYIGILFDRYSHLVFAVSMKYLKNEEDCKDIVIQVFEKLHHDLITYEIYHFSSWLHTVTKNHCLRFLSGKKYSIVDSEKIPDHPEVDNDDVFGKEYLPHLDEAIHLLKEEQRICIELFYIQNMSYQKISERTKFTLNEVKSHIQNGKRNLKMILLKKLNDK